MAKILSYYGERKRVPGFSSADDGMTRQEFRRECDINTLMAKYINTGVMPQNVRTGQYGDFSSAEDYHAAQNILLNARAQFDALPSSVRDRFGNNPAKYLAFLHNPDNLEEARKLGVLKEVQAPAPPISVRVIPDAPPVPAPAPAPVVPPVVK